ncbi:Phage integrase family protein [Qipengyuania nanhaisediminis]|uniref:Phage integrase family protein n=2 Tax=Qipengyuania nanhaisediminis TaxID=604088 RepID=A0A1I5KBN4_9SPHN|nr:Phage integrase family protein [Qipengyuania nanhaisediminis]
MAGTGNRLTKSLIKALPNGTVKGDGGNLWIASSKTGRKRWEFRYTFGGKRHCMGLGPWPEVDLVEARDKAFENRKLLISGIDPLAEKQMHKPRKITTFREVAEEAIERFKEGWKSEKQEPQWRNSLTRYAYPILGEMHVASVTPEHVRDAIQPIWIEKPDMASRVQNRIERILDLATVLKLRAGDNPARLKGNLEHLLPKVEKEEKHHAALPHEDLASFMRELRAEEGMQARAQELLILTSGRTAEATGARWEEFDLDDALWVIPGARMKKKQDHRVALSRQAVTLLQNLWELRDESNPHVFHSDMSAAGHIADDLRRLRIRMGRTDITTHGFRSTFRDWVNDETDYHDDLAGKAQSHRDSNKTRAAYRRTDMLKKRRPLMQDWADFCDGKRVAANAAEGGAK